MKTTLHAQTTHTILMIEPAAFGFNPQTAVNNYFQHETHHAQHRALQQFQRMVKRLRDHGVHVITVKDTPIPHTPDSIFPNNAISFHCDGSVRLYPMFADNRRQEITPATLAAVRDAGFVIHNVQDFRHHADEGRFLEGTGSMILDRENRIAYACRAARTDEGLFNDFCKQYDFEGILFSANQSVNNQRLPIYHTNVMMAVAETFAVICLDALDIAEEKALVLAAFARTNKTIIDITETQMHQFAGNMLQVRTSATKHELALVMSSSAYHSLAPAQIAAIEAHCPIIHTDVSVIEENGGGSVRCMMAEVFLPRSAVANANSCH